MKNWIKKHQGLLLIALLLVIARGIQVVIFMYYEDMTDFLTSILNFFTN